MVHFIYIKVKGVTCFNAFMADFLMLNDSVKCPDNKESKYKVKVTFHCCLSSLFFVWFVCDLS